VQYNSAVVLTPKLLIKGPLHTHTQSI